MSPSDVRADQGCRTVMHPSFAIDDAWPPVKACLITAYANVTHGSQRLLTVYEGSPSAVHAQRPHQSHIIAYKLQAAMPAAAIHNWRVCKCCHRPAGISLSNWMVTGPCAAAGRKVNSGQQAALFCKAGTSDSIPKRRRTSFTSATSIMAPNTPSLTRSG